MSASSMSGVTVGPTPTADQLTVERDRAQDGLPAKALAPLSLRRNFSWTLAGTLVYAATQFAILSVLAHLSGSAVVGLWNEAFDLDGRPPGDGTTVPGVQRVLKADAGGNNAPSGARKGVTP